MMYLFERISAPPRGADGKQEPFDEAAAVMAQIQRIASTGRQAGQGIAAVPWGMQAVTTMGANATIQLEAYARTLGEAIERHEPRLSSVHVTVERREDALSPYGLLISATFPDEDQPRNVRVPAPF